MRSDPGRLDRASPTDPLRPRNGTSARPSWTSIGADGGHRAVSGLGHDQPITHDDMFEPPAFRIEWHLHDPLPIKSDLGGDQLIGRSAAEA